MKEQISPQLVASVFLKYLTLQPTSMLIHPTEETEIKMWICPESGAPSLGSGRQDSMPLDCNVACVFLSSEMLGFTSSTTDTVTANDSLDQLLTIVSLQMKAQIESFELQNGPVDFISKLIDGDDEIGRIATTFFYGDHRQPNQVKH